MAHLYQLTVYDRSPKGDLIRAHSLIIKVTPARLARLMFRCLDHYAGVDANPV